MVKGLEIRRKKDYFENFYCMGANATNTVSNGVAILTKSNIKTARSGRADWPMKEDRERIQPIRREKTISKGGSQNQAGNPFWVEIRLHAENQLPRLPGSALKVPGWVPTHY